MDLRQSTDKFCEESMMIRCLGLLVLAAAALAEERPVSDRAGRKRRGFL